MVIIYKYDSPLGNIFIKADNNSLIGVSFYSDVFDKHKNKIIEMTETQLNEYFQGKRKTFNIPLSLKGTDFQRQVFNELRKIPYGETKTYKEIAYNIGNINAQRAIGNANNKNPIAIIIPCHRVIGSNGKLTGYAGGLNKKNFLLNLEKRNKKEN